MAYTITQDNVKNVLHNLMGHRTAPGGTEDDLDRFVQSGFDYCWRYYPWTFALKNGTIAADGILPDDYDHEGYRRFATVTEVTLDNTLSSTNSGSAIIWDSAEGKYKLTPATADTLIYQYMPPTLSNTGVPFPSARVVAMAALIYVKMEENPSRADVQQEWDILHSELDRLVAIADRNRPRQIITYHDKFGTHTGDVGA